MFLKEFARFSLQHRTLYCYLILSIWIFLLIAGMYKYIGSSDSSSNFLNNKNFYNGLNKDPGDKEDSLRAKAKKLHQQDCNPPSNIVISDEGGNIDGWSLQGILLLIRHGDRGPMAHVRGISSVDCSYEGDVMSNKYKNYLNNSTSSTSAGHWMKTGPFHGFPLLPSSPKACLLGQLTQRGVSQLMHVGDIIRQAYSHSLGLYHKPTPQFKSATSNSSDTTSNPIFHTDDIVIYSTRYRRTFQSAMALMYALLPPEKWQALQLQESHSLSFCFSDCACQQAENLKKQLSKESTVIMNAHPAVGAVVQWIGAALLQNQPSPNQINPLEVRDAILSLVCHDAPLPCRKIINSIGEQNLQIVSSTQDPLNQDFINIDQDDNSINFNQPNTDDPDDAASSDQEPDIEGCVEKSHVAALMSYTHWHGMKETKSRKMKQQGLLRAYGLIRNIVGYMLKMISGDKVKFVLYSGHDKTLEYLLASLGLSTDSPFIPYAARMAFEVYKSEKDTLSQYYFRLVYNGRDVTNSVSVCEGGKSLRVGKGIRGERADLCPIENIIRFIHDDYFLPLNATNYKEACAIQRDNYF